MSGIFNDIFVLFILILFVVSIVNVIDVILIEFKKVKNKIYLVENKINEKDFLFDS